MQIPKHILVIRLSAMGDVAMVVPVLRALTQQHPDIKITVVTRAFFKPLFRDLKNVSVFTAYVKDQHKGILGLYRLTKQLRVLDIDAVADLHNVLRSKLLRVFLGIRPTVVIDKGRAEKKALVTGKLFKALKTTHQRYADVFKTLGVSVNLLHVKYPERKPLPDSILDIIGNDHLKWIGIAPFAAHQGKMYPLKQMVEVINVLSQHNKVLLFGGGKKETDALNAIEKKTPNCVNLAGKLSFEQELDVISNLDIMVSMDSGNAHIAAMLGVKVVTIWGVTHPYAGFAPFNQPEDYMLLADRDKYPKIPTSIYGNKAPKGYEQASASITPESIIDKVNKLLLLK